MHAASESRHLSRAPFPGQHPYVLECQYRCRRFEVGVVVHHNQVVGRGDGGGQQIMDADRPMSAGAGQLALRVERSLPVFVVGRQVFVGESTVVPQLLVFRGAAGAVQRFGI